MLKQLIDQIVDWQKNYFNCLIVHILTEELQLYFLLYNSKLGILDCYSVRMQHLILSFGQLWSAHVSNSLNLDEQ